MIKLPSVKFTSGEKTALKHFGLAAFVAGGVLLGAADAQAQDGVGSQAIDFLTTSPAEALVSELDAVGVAVNSVAPIAVAAGVYNLTMHPAKKLVFS